MSFHSGVSETTTTTGLTSSFVLGGGLIVGKSSFIERLANKEEITYSITDGAKTEWRIGEFDQPTNCLSRGFLIFSTTGDKINWGTGRKIIESVITPGAGSDIGNSTVIAKARIPRGIFSGVGYPQNLFSIVDSTSAGVPGFNQACVINTEFDLSVPGGTVITGTVHVATVGTAKILGGMIFSAGAGELESVMGGFFTGDASASCGGSVSPGTSAGKVYGGAMAGTLSAGAIGYNAVTGVEIDCSIFTGASADWRCGVLIADINGAVRGTLGDAALVIGAVPGGAGSLGFYYGIDFGGSLSGQCGVSTDGTLIGCGVAGTNVATGINLSNFNFSGNAYQSTGVVIDGAGNATFTSLTTGAAASTALILTGFTSGSVLFAGVSSVVSQDNTNLFWDDTNNWLGIGIATPNARLHVQDGNISLGNSFPLIAINDTNVTPTTGGLVRLIGSGGSYYWQINTAAGSDFSTVNNAWIIGGNGDTTFGRAVIYTGMTYANRPGTPITGMVVNITDSNTVVWGATVAGGGGNNVLSRYNGTNWTVIGI